MRVWRTKLSIWGSLMMFCYRYSVNNFTSIMFYVGKDGKESTANAIKAFTLSKKKAVSLLRRHKRGMSEECREGYSSEETRETFGVRERGVSVSYIYTDVPIHLSPSLL